MDVVNLSSMYSSAKTTGERRQDIFTIKADGISTFRNYEEFKSRNLIKVAFLKNGYFPIFKRVCSIPIRI